MTRLLRAELLKLRSTRTAWGLLIGLVPYVALNAFGRFAQSAFTGARQPGSPAPPPLTDPQTIRSVLSGALPASTLLLVLGILMITTEYRHQTATPTFLAAPRRSMVVAAKLLAALIVGVAYGVVAVLVAIVTGLVCYAAKGETFTVNVDQAPQALVGIVAVIAVYAVIGIGLGTLVRNQVAAILVAVGWTLAGEAIASLLLGLWHHQGDKIYRFFPGNAASAITDQYLGGGVRLLAPWAGAVVLVAYGLVFAAVGSALTLRRDVT